jgi:hypothetical protein
MKTKWYFGPGAHQNILHIFKSAVEPTERTHGHWVRYSVGPWPTRKRARCLWSRCRAMIAPCDGVTRICEVPGVPGVFLIIAHTGKFDGLAIPLPASRHRAIYPDEPDARCHCPGCKAHPADMPMWDTVRVTQGYPPWVVHWPDLARVYGQAHPNGDLR